MALAYTAPTWTDGSGEGISASNLQAISNCIEGLVQGSDKAVHNVQINGSVIILTYADGTTENFTAVDLKGISTIEKTATVDLVDTYTITYTDGTTATFNVTNGEQGVTGPEGPKGPEGPQGPAGADGADGISVTGVSLQSTSGKVKTYRMTFSDGTYFDYNVTDGEDGSGSGDMTKAVYDSNDAVANAGGISAFVTGLINALATVARTGAYSDLTGLPTIPTVNNGTLTIQQNGTTKGRFDANQSSLETVNIVTDEWSTSAQVSSGSVSFTIPSNTFGYDLYCERPNVSVTNVAVNGTTVTYTLSGAQNGDNCKLRILK